MSRSLLFAVTVVLFSTASASLAAAQRRSAQLLAAARGHIATQHWDSADVELSDALDSAPYIMDSAWACVWRGILEYQRGRSALAQLSFRRAFALHPDPGVRGLDTIAPGLVSLFDAEFRAARTFRTWDLDEPVRWVIAPQFEYPRQLRSRRVAGTALVRMLVDTLGQVDEQSIEILELPDPAFRAPLKQMMLSAVFTPARIGGKPVRTLVAYRLNLTPPPPRDPVRLIDAARTQLRMGQTDSALMQLEDALDPANGATPAVRVYAELVRGMAWQIKRDTARAARSFQLGLAQYRELRAQGVDFAPFVRSLADSARLTARRE